MLVLDIQSVSSFMFNLLVDDHIYIFIAKKTSKVKSIEAGFYVTPEAGFHYTLCNLRWMRWP